MMLTQFEPIIPQEALLAANYNLVALGHIHRPQKIMHRDWYYSGAINAMNFNDEGQQRAFGFTTGTSWEHGRVFSMKHLSESLRPLNSMMMM